MPALIIILFFTGMMILGLVVIVVETWWVVATVGITHIVASAVLGILLVKELSREERRQKESDEVA